jgi:hypothetical protein
MKDKDYLGTRYNSLRYQILFQPFQNETPDEVIIHPDLLTQSNVSCFFLV